MIWRNHVRADGGEVEPEDETEDDSTPEGWHPVGAVSGQYGDFFWLIETNGDELRRRHVRIHGLPRADDDIRSGRYDR